jgi:hypothetical protein
MSISDALSPLVVDEGQHAWADGVLVRTPLGVRILGNEGFVAPDGASSHSVKLHAAEIVDLEPLIGSDVVVAGIFEDGGLTVDQVEERPVALRRTKPLELPRAFIQSGRTAQRGSAADGERVKAELAELREVSLALREGGLVMSFGELTGPDGRLRAVATVLHLPTWLATRLSRFPADVLVLDVLVKPVEALG